MHSGKVANLDPVLPSAPTVDALLGMQKMQALKDEMKVFRALAAKNEAHLLDLKTRLQQAEADRFPAALTYGLIAALLACLAAIAYLWKRPRRVSEGDEDWWSASVAASSAVHSDPELSLPDFTLMVHPPTDTNSPLTKTVTPAMAGAATEPADSDVNLMEMSDAVFDDLMKSTSEQSRVLPNDMPASSVFGMGPKSSLVRRFNTELILDIRQQAEFFVSLGQTEQAVKILKHQIDDSEEANPFVYLDLLNLLHSLGLKADFKQLRETFHQVFNGRVPEFAFFKDEGKDLVAHPDALSRITALWSTPSVFAVIEAYLFHDSQGTKRQSFDLAAFRDLLLLHAVAQSVVPGAVGNDVEPSVAP